MSEIKFAAELRKDFGKGASRRARAAGKIPAVIYGRDAEPVHVLLPGHETSLALRVANAVMSIEIPGAKPVMALAKEVQRHPYKPIIQHVDFMVVKKGEKVTVEVALNVVDDEKVDGIVMVDMQTLTLEVEATNIPESVEHSIAGLGVGDQVFAKDLKLPDGATFVGDEEAIVLVINAPAVAAETEESAEEADEASAEGDSE